MTFSAPKSVSVMAIVGGDERLVAAHETAVREALEESGEILGH
jgi:conjugative relaxase-like TrwC/TraI family protein